MRRGRQTYQKWDMTKLAISPTDSEIDHLIDASGHKAELMANIRALHTIIDTAMCTSLISYQFKKMERKS